MLGADFNFVKILLDLTNFTPFHHQQSAQAFQPSLVFELFGNWHRKVLSYVLAYSNNDGCIQFFNATGIIYRCLENDKDSLFYALGIFSELKLAKIRDLSNNFDVSVSTI